MLRYRDIEVPTFKDKTFKGIIKSITLASICGVVLGLINLLLGMTQNKLSFSLLPAHFTNALQGKRT
jgi:hypothetical protein